MIELYLAFLDEPNKGIIVYDHKYNSKLSYNGEVRAFKDLYLAMLANPDLTFTGRRENESINGSHC